VRPQRPNKGPTGPRRPDRRHTHRDSVRGLEGATAQPRANDGRGPPPVGRILRKRTVTSGFWRRQTHPSAVRTCRRHQGRHGRRVCTPFRAETRPAPPEHPNPRSDDALVKSRRIPGPGRRPSPRRQPPRPVAGGSNLPSSRQGWEWGRGGCAISSSGYQPQASLVPCGLFLASDDLVGLFGCWTVRLCQTLSRRAKPGDVVDEEVTRDPWLDLMR
jgi:hypothetical protein